MHSRRAVLCTHIHAHVQKHPYMSTPPTQPHTNLHAQPCNTQPHRPLPTQPHTNLLIHTHHPVAITTRIEVHGLCCSVLRCVAVCCSVLQCVSDSPPSRHHYSNRGWQPRSGCGYARLTEFPRPTHFGAKL